MAEKSQNHLRPNSIVSFQSLLIMRVLMWLASSIVWILILNDWIQSQSHRYIYYFKYFTEWGLAITAIYFTIVLVAYIEYYVTMNKPKKLENAYSPFKLWKWVSFLFQAAILWEIIITLVFWTILWPGYSNHSFHYLIIEMMYHLFPVVYLIIDFCMNRVYFEID